MCYFKSLDPGSVKLWGVQAAALGKGAAKNGHLLSPPHPSMGLSLGLLLLSEVTQSEHQRRNNLPHFLLGKHLCFQYVEIQLFLG